MLVRMTTRVLMLIVPVRKEDLVEINTRERKERKKRERGEKKEE